LKQISVYRISRYKELRKRSNITSCRDSRVIEETWLRGNMKKGIAVWFWQKDNFYWVMDEIREKSLHACRWLDAELSRGSSQTKKSFVLARKDKPEYPCCPSTKTVERSNCVVRSHDHLSRSKMHCLYWVTVTRKRKLRIIIFPFRTVTKLKNSDYIVPLANTFLLRRAFTTCYLPAGRHWNTKRVTLIGFAFCAPFCAQTNLFPLTSLKAWWYVECHIKVPYK